MNVMGLESLKNNVTILSFSNFQKCVSFWEVFSLRFFKASGKYSWESFFA